MNIDIIISSIVVILITLLFFYKPIRKIINTSRAESSIIKTYPYWAAQSPFINGTHSANAFKGAWIAVHGVASVADLDSIFDDHKKSYDNSPYEWIDLIEIYSLNESELNGEILELAKKYASLEGFPLISDLINENDALRQRLDMLIQRARVNEQKQELFNILSLEVSSSKSFEELMILLTNSFVDKFQWDVFNLILIDRNGEIKSTQEFEAVFKKYNKNIYIVDDKEKIKLLSEGPESGIDVISKYDWVLQNKENLGSGIYIPLVYNSNFKGAILIASKNEQSFVSGQATTFFNNLADHIQIAVDKFLYTNNK